jgi:hypothetical protein
MEKGRSPRVERREEGEERTLGSEFPGREEG